MYGDKYQYTTLVFLYWTHNTAHLFIVLVFEVYLMSPK